jgi:excisionase family DNA binding protein
MSDGKLFFSPTELARYLDLPVSTIYRWNHAGGGPKRLRVGKHVRYRLSDVNRWLDEASEPRPA